MEPDLVGRIAAKVALLPVEQQKKALEYVEALLEQSVNRPLRGGRSLMGAFAHLGLSVTDEDIEEARREMWRHFPREET